MSIMLKQKCKLLKVYDKLVMLLLFFPPQYISNKENDDNSNNHNKKSVIHHKRQREEKLCYTGNIYETKSFIDNKRYIIEMKNTILNDRKDLQLIVVVGQCFMSSIGQNC